MSEEDQHADTQNALTETRRERELKVLREQVAGLEHLLEKAEDDKAAALEAAEEAEEEKEVEHGVSSKVEAVTINSKLPEPKDVPLRGMSALLQAEQNERQFQQRSENSI